MKTILIILFFMFTSAVSAEGVHPVITKFAVNNCNHKIFPNKEDQIDCITDIVNCVIVDGGETDLTKLTLSCLNKASQRRIYEQRRK